MVDNPDEHRFELRVGDTVAGFAAYRAGDSVHVFTHTEINPAYEGKGLGSVLIRGALDQVRARGRGVLPVCPFVRSFVERHPDYQDLVPPGDRARFGLPAAG